jgi:hypothetical protein
VPTLGPTGITADGGREVLGLVPYRRLVDDPADVPVYGSSRAMLLDAAMDSGSTSATCRPAKFDKLESASR